MTVWYGVRHSMIIYVPPFSSTEKQFFHVVSKNALDNDPGWL
jgi:hypothetical protein